ncbi:RagB/SusD family nutrient uptake outer membrane protein [Compostibacter hankyongensis]
MKPNKIFTGLSLTLFTTLLMGSCTKLDETPYDKVIASEFLQTKDDVVRDFLRPFEHAYWSIQGNGELFYLNEDASDELMTPSREGDWFDGGTYQRVHYHTWTSQDGFTSSAWNALYQGVDFATNSLEDIEKIDPVKFDMTEAEKEDFAAELRTLRAWFYLRLFDYYRNIEIITKVQGESQGQPQSTPQETFNFIEKELKDAIPKLPTRQDLGENALGRWTKAGAAALLVRLYLNAEVYIGQDKFSECAQLCQDIIDGKYGSYTLEDTWDAPFAWDNGESPENIFAFPSSFGYTHWQYTSGMYWWMGPYNAPDYFGFTDWGQMNTRYALQPGRDVDSVEYPFQLGKPFIKFQKYPDDLRLKKYKNLGNSRREGMFLYGYLTYTNENGQPDTVRSTRGYTLFCRDQVGHFFYTPPGKAPSDKESNMNHADQNSGVWPVKYPYYPSGDDHKISSAYAEIRLAEIYYSLAECKYRTGDKAGAAALLNAVRKRNYPAGSSSLYKADGSQLTDQEMLDEWGREFLVEGRRRIDMIRWGVFTTGTWWDKKPDADKHTEIFPIGIDVLNINPQLKQNPGYN